MTRLYHGSHRSIPAPLTGVGRRELDFGPGFYVTILRDQAVITVYPKEFDGMANGNYVTVTVVDKNIGFVDDQIDQEEVE